MTFAIIALCALLLFSMYKAAKDRTEVIARWSRLIDGLNYSVEDFYQELEVELKAHNIEKLKI